MEETTDSPTSMVAGMAGVAGVDSEVEMEAGMFGVLSETIFQCIPPKVMVSMLFK